MGQASLTIATFLAPNMLPVYSFVAEYVGTKLRLETSLIVGSSFSQFERGEADAGFICGLPYVQLSRHEPSPVELLAAPVLQGERYAGRPIYFSDVIVRRDSPFHSFSDLRGHTWSYNDPDSHSGYNVTRYHLLRMGETGGFFGRVVEAGFHQRSIELVASGEIDASAIDSQVLAIELREHPELGSRLRVIDSLGPSTIQPVVASSRLPASLREDIKSVLLELGEDPPARRVLNWGFVDRFVEVYDSTYDDIRQMLETAEQAGIAAIS